MIDKFQKDAPALDLKKASNDAYCLIRNSVPNSTPQECIDNATATAFGVLAALKATEHQR